MRGIRKKQRLLVELLTTNAFRNGTMKESTKALLSDTIRDVAEYEQSKAPFNHECEGSPTNQPTNKEPIKC